MEQLNSKCPTKSQQQASEHNVEAEIWQTLRIRKAEIIPRYRERFEEMGVEVVRSYFVQPIGTVVWEDHQGKWPVHALKSPMQLWLREQYDRVERKETWLITMEIAITTFVAAELVMSILDFCFRHSR